MWGGLYSLKLWGRISLPRLLHFDVNWSHVTIHYFIGSVNPNSTAVSTGSSVLSVVFLRERAGLLQLVGMVASAAVIVLLNLRGGSASAGASPRTMILLSVGACIANGLVNFFIRINESLGGNSNCFFAVLYLTAAVCGIFVSLFYSAAKKISFPLRNVLSVRLLPWLMLLGACNGVCFYMTGRIAGYLNAAAQFTITTAASILLSLSVGILCRQEKLSIKILLSFLLCLAAVGCQALSLVG